MPAFAIALMTRLATMTIRIEMAIPLGTMLSLVNRRGRQSTLSQVANTLANGGFRYLRAHRGTNEARRTPRSTPAH